jgi:hypothetical protein
MCANYTLHKDYESKISTMCVSIILNIFIPKSNIVMMPSITTTTTEPVPSPGKGEGL